MCKRFGAVVALDELSLAVPAGTVCGLLGPNGAGKTTAVRMLTTLLRLDAGARRGRGVDVARDPAGVRRRIGLVGQNAAVDEVLSGPAEPRPVRAAVPPRVARARASARTSCWRASGWRSR